MNVEVAEKILSRYKEINAELEYRQDANFTQLYKELSKIESIAQAYTEYLNTQKAIIENEEIGKDPEYTDFVKEENKKLNEQLENLDKQISQQLRNKNSIEGRNAIIEIRPGAGGDEACIFVSDLFNMYWRWAEHEGYTVQLMDCELNEQGGFKECAFKVTGEGVFGKLQFESGVHRVQRVPETESQGRVHTSTVTVAVLPEAEEVDVYIDPRDLIITACHSSGAGGQNVNKVSSAIRVTHVPTGITIKCQEERSQLNNKARALERLRALLYTTKLEQTKQEYADTRKNQIGTGDRSERIRTYNFQQNRVTDHRINLSLFSLPNFLNGNINEMLNALQEAAAI